MLRKKKISGLKKVILTLIIVLIFSVIGYLLYDSFSADRFKKVTPEAEEEIEVLTTSRLEVEFFADFLTQPPYTDLSLPPRVKLPVTVDKMGRQNPFRQILFNIVNR